MRAGTGRKALGSLGRQSRARIIVAIISPSTHRQLRLLIYTTVRKVLQSTLALVALGYGHEYKRGSASGRTSARECYLVGCCTRELRLCDAERILARVVCRVEPLEERQTDDKVQAAAGVGTDVTDNEVNVVSLGPNRCIELQGCLV